MLLPNKIILHCSATEDTASKSWKAIQHYHTKVRGWTDIGYHYGIEIVDEGIYFLRGRPYWKRGAHCKANGRNFDSLGLCVVGKFDDEPPSPMIYDATIKALSQLCFAFSIKPDDVFGHSEFERRKTCPGKKWDMRKLRDDLRLIVPELNIEAGMLIGGQK